MRVCERSFGPIISNSDGWKKFNWTALSDSLVDSLEVDATKKTISTRQGHVIEYDEISAARSKETIDRVDSELARVLGLSAENADFITNYDVKYRLAGVYEVTVGVTE